MNIVFKKFNALDLVVAKKDFSYFRFPGNFTFRGN
jgi:hypothetical protein